MRRLFVTVSGTTAESLSPLLAIMLNASDQAIAGSQACGTVLRMEKALEGLPAAARLSAAAPELRRLLAQERGDQVMDGQAGVELGSCKESADALDQ